MITLAKGLKNSLIVLELLRSDEEFNRQVHLSIGTFTNCREQGLTFVLMSGEDENHNYIPVKIFTWCVYEHRNSDSIIINGKYGFISLNGDLPYKTLNDKYSVIASFDYDKYGECAETLKKLILAVLEEGRMDLIRKKLIKTKKVKNV